LPEIISGKLDTFVMAGFEVQDPDFLLSQAITGKRNTPTLGRERGV